MFVREGGHVALAYIASSHHRARQFGVQVSNFMDFGKDDSDEEKVAALRSVVAEGDPCFVKVLDVRQDEASGEAT